MIGSALALRPPPAPDVLQDFPVRILSPETPLWRCSRQEFGPWWFSDTLDGRFDLATPSGTCYLATEELGALLEVIGPDRLEGTVTTRFLASRRLRRLHLPRPFRLADLTVREAAGYGITSEINTVLPYGLPQAWASALHKAGAEGVVFRLRHDPAGSEGIALFGRRGERRHWRRGRGQAISGDLIRRLWEECRISVVDVPHSQELRIFS